LPGYLYAIILFITQKNQIKMYRIIVLAFAVILSTGLTAQTASKFGMVWDSNYQGVKVFAATGFSGTTTVCIKEGAIYSFPQGIKSVKVYGPWRLVNTSNSLVISQDDPYYNGTGGGTWRLEKTSERFYGIAYSQANFKGEATFLKIGRTTSFHTPVKSLLLGLPAKLGYSNTTGYQTCTRGKKKSLRYPVARVDLDWKYGECAGSGWPYLGFISF
jgi:hypothetical protein